MRNWRLVFGLGLITLLALLSAGRMAVDQTYNGAGAGRQDKIVVILPGGVHGVAQTLDHAGIIQHPLIFRAAAWWTRHDGPLRTGEYLFPAHASLRRILGILRFGAQVQHQATIPEGLTSAQIAAILNKLPEATGGVAPPPEGSVWPQTYDYVWGTKRSAILARMQLALHQHVQTLWVHRDPQSPLQTPAQAVILASIVQQETPLVAQMPMVAAVYENRLRRGMALQADPTVIFAISQGQKSVGMALNPTDLRVDSPYNTYLYKGLPPGPICAPGLAALQAVLHPARSHALYFVAMEDGTHRSVFSDTLAQHEANIRRYLDK